jgi:membrane protein DedA with SNARE-associated domain
VNTLMDWVASIDLSTLYALLAATAFVESIFPPAPADLVVALLAFIAARRGADYPAVVASIVAGSALGAMVIYAIARRFGADWMHAQLRRLKLIGAEEKLERLYAHYGLAALFVSRFVPGLRAVVPPMAGALRVPWLRTVIVISVASAIWYGLVIWVAFQVGADWVHVRASLHILGRRVGLTAVVLIVALAWLGRRLWLRHRAKHPVAE